MVDHVGQAALSTWSKTIPSTATTAVSRVVNSWAGMSGTCAILLMRRPTRAMNGTMSRRPGLRVVVQVPSPGVP